MVLVGGRRVLVGSRQARLGLNLAILMRRLAFTRILQHSIMISCVLS